MSTPPLPHSAQQINEAYLATRGVAPPFRIPPTMQFHTSLLWRLVNNPAVDDATLAALIARLHRVDRSKVAMLDRVLGKGREVLTGGVIGGKAEGKYGSLGLTAREIPPEVKRR